MDKKATAALFKKFQSLKIMVIGDVMVDSYLWGKVERISPEAPVPVVSCNKKEDRPGGAANVALNLKSLGAEPLLCSVIGKDSCGDTFLNLLKKENLSKDFIIRDEERKTTNKTRVISGSQQLLRVDEESSHFLSSSIEKKMIEKISSALKEGKVNAIIFQDYDKGVISPSLINSVVNLSKGQKIPVLVDPKKRNFSEYKNIDLFKPNFKEYAEGLKSDFNSADSFELFEAGKKFLEKTSNKLLLLTLSEKGVFICSTKKYKLIPAHKRDIADVSGAGDTVISVAALCLASGCNPSEIAALSNLAGGLVCEKVGVVPIEKKHFFDECCSLEIPKW